MLAIAGAAVSAGGAIYGGMQANAQGKYAQRVAEQNASLEDRSRLDAISRGETDQRNQYRKLAQALGEARVHNSAAGLDVGFGSAAGMEQDLSLIGYEDSHTIAENTNKAVQGYDISAANYRMQGAASRAQGKAAQTAGFISAAGTLLSTASQVKGMSAPKGLASTTSAPH